MVRGVVGLIVRGREKTALEALGVQAEVALTPFAGKYRFLDLALATMRNSGVCTTYVAHGASVAALRAHLASASAAAGGRRATLVRPLPDDGPGDAGRSALGRAFGHCAALTRKRAADAIVVLTADHVLQADLGPLAEAHRRSGADLTLVTVPASFAEPVSARPLLDVTSDGTVVGATALDHESLGAHRALWTGDFMVRTGALPLLLDALTEAVDAPDDVVLLRLLGSRCSVVAHDTLALPGVGPARGPYWHEPATVDAYYVAHMDLCTARPPFELNDLRWPLSSAPSGLGPARLVSDAGGRHGRALNTILSDGCVVQGAIVRNVVLGQGVVVESCAEVEDSIILDGSRIGAGAQIRRAVIGPNVVIPRGESIGYDAVPAGAIRTPSGLTLVAS